MSEKRISLGINVSIFVILTIFGVLLSLPLRLLLNTSYYNRNETASANDTIETNSTENPSVEIVMIPLDHRKLKRCPRFEYEDRLISVFRSDYDGNCTYTSVHGTEVTETCNDGDENNENDRGERRNDTSKILNAAGDKNSTENGEEGGKDRRAKSVPVAGHILVTMLLISTIAALVEVLRIRFARDKDSSKAGSGSSRKTSTVELPIPRRFLPRYPMKIQRSFEIQGMHRSALRLLGARPPPLIRRSSFPTQQSKQNSGSIGGTPNNRISRRQSAESDDEIGVPICSLPHRTRLIRRH